MKKVSTILSVILFVMAGCGDSKQSTENLLTVDVTKSYPKKELILQDFMDVEYIALETNDEFLCSGLVEAIGKDIIIVRNHNHLGRDGNIFIFDRKGKALRKINRKGQGGEEYTDIYAITLDENNGEMFVNDVFADKIVVYDLDGIFKRSFKQKQKYHNIYNFDRENLICYNSSDKTGHIYVIISKQDGSIIREIIIPFEEMKSIWVTFRDEAQNISWGATPDHHPIIPYLDGWILTEPSSDTVYRYLPDHTMIPFIARTPSIRSMDPSVFLFPGILTDRYYFMESVKKLTDINDPFSDTDLIYDRQEKAIFQYTVYNGDYSGKKQVYMTALPLEILACKFLEADQLVESYRKGELKGKLKEIAATLEEDSNPVIMLMKDKK
jgi:hypothetical protein